MRLYRCDGRLNHNLLDGIAGGQGRFCSKYLLPVGLVFKDINSHMFIQDVQKRKMSRGDLLFLSSKKSTPVIIIHLDL